jgi:hypothetical protein
LGSERLGHAFSAIRDAALVEELKRRQIPLELNPSSNVRTGVCASFAEHPLRRYFDAGLMVTLNSDDPAFFGSTLENEYRLAHSVQGFGREELKTLAANSFRASFLPDVRGWRGSGQRHGALVAFGAGADADGVGFGFFVAHDQDVGVFWLAKSRILAFIFSLRSSTSTRRPAASSSALTFGRRIRGGAR